MEIKLTSRFEDALLYAARLHARQVRKVSGNPYIAHLLSVAALVIEDGGSEDEVIAALLHDAVEDQGGDVTRQEIRIRFGERVAAIVDGCTDADSFPKPPWRERKEKFISSLSFASSEVLRVTAADKLDNVRSILISYDDLREGVWEHFKGKKDGTLWYYQAIAQVLCSKMGGALTRSLEKAVAELKLLQ